MRQANFKRARNCIRIFGAEPAEGLNVLAEARALVHKTEERWWEAELYRLTGQLLLAQEDAEDKGQKLEEAEACFRQTLDIACR